MYRIFVLFLFVLCNFVVRAELDNDLPDLGVSEGTVTSIEKWAPGDVNSTAETAAYLRDLILANSNLLETTNSHTELLSSRSSLYVNRAFEAFQKNKIDKALRTLVEFYKTKSDIPEYDLGFVERFIGNIYTATVDEDEEARRLAIQYLSSAVARGSLGEREHQQCLERLVSLHIWNGDMTSAINYAIGYLRYSPRRAQVMSDERWNALVRTAASQ